MPSLFKLMIAGFLLAAIAAYWSGSALSAGTQSPSSLPPSSQHTSPAQPPLRLASVTQPVQQGEATAKPLAAALEPGSPAGFPEDQGAPAAYLPKPLDFLQSQQHIATPGIGDIVTITVHGDIGLNRDMQTVDPLGVWKFGRRQSWVDATRGLAPLVDGDINFANLETVVTDDNRLPGESKQFRFRSHTEGVRHLVRTGFNVLSLANNHSMDFGSRSPGETLKHLATMDKDGLKAYAGIGMNREEAVAPKTFAVKGADIAFSALGIITRGFAHHRAGPERPGQAAFQSPEDWEEVTRRLAEAPANYRMLSVHYGINLEVAADSRQIRDFRRDAVIGRGIDLVLGHHPHVPRGVERVGPAVIFYGLGNSLHHGMQDMGGRGLCRDFGLMGRLHLLRQPNGKLEMRAIEAIPITNMHIEAKPFDSVEQSHGRIYALNHLARQFDDDGDKAEGVRFSPRPNGTGLFCMPGADRDPGSIGQLCRGWQPAGPIPDRWAGRVRSSCGAGGRGSDRVADTPASGSGKSAKSQKRPSKAERARARQNGGANWRYSGNRR